ncbi:hypothetical protein, partial [Bartonella bovis]|uniref:hypothetical protein n=1 Tax=Bartonella bovis TaxID=155194 RepID=UPI0019563E22
NGTIGFNDGANNYGVRVGREVTSATLTNVTITGGGNGKGVWMEGKTLTMDGVNISGVKVGVEATAGTLVISGGSIGFNDGADNYGVKVGREVISATLTNVTITGGGNGKGVIVDRTKMIMEEVRISNVAMGVEVTGGNLTVNGGEMTGVQTGITMLGSGTLVVNNNAKITFTGEHGV